ncbi:MAG: hypothetical protein JW891_16105 [Candidatus Lokiarchaeota archaeon]|nr:hypothetical protein [Candidatus Lokiarchaeota archaeon]
MNSVVVKKVSIAVTSIFGCFGVLILYLINAQAIIYAYQTIEGGFFVVLIITLRMLVLAFMALTMFRRWFKAEKQFYDDIPFLFGIFFAILVFGKSLDLLYNLIFFTATTSAFDLVYKLRYIVAVLDLVPLYVLSLEVILYAITSYKTKVKLESKRSRNKVKAVILGLVVTLELLVVVFFLDVHSSRYILPLIVIPSILMIALIFAFTYRNKLLTQVHSLLLCVSFLLYLMSQILRPVAQTLLGLTATYIVFSEIVDLSIFLVVFAGLLVKPRYSDFVK